MNTNVIKKHTKVAIPERLTPEERQKLKDLTTGYRRMKMAEEGSTVNRSIIYKAIAGMTITPQKAVALREFIAGQPVENPNLKTLSDDETGADQAQAGGKGKAIKSECSGTPSRGY